MASQVPPDPQGNPHHILQCRFNLHLFGGALPRLETGRVGVFRGQGAHYGTETIILDSGELPHELGYPPLPLSHREIPHDSISPPPYARARTRRVQQPTACTKGSWLPSWSQHHLPLPSLLQTSPRQTFWSPCGRRDEVAGRPRSGRGQPLAMVLCRDR